MKFGFIAKHRGIWAVDWMCGALGVSRGGFYACRAGGCAILQTSLLSCSESIYSQTAIVQNLRPDIIAIV